MIVCEAPCLSSTKPPIARGSDSPEFLEAKIVLVGRSPVRASADTKIVCRRHEAVDVQIDVRAILFHPSLLMSGRAAWKHAASSVQSGGEPARA